MPASLPNYLRRRIVLRWGLFVLVLAVIGLGKYFQNRVQFAHLQDRPLRVRADFRQADQARARWWPVLEGLLGKHVDDVREKLDPTGEIARGGGWKVSPAMMGINEVAFGDPITGRTLKLEFKEHRLANAWVDPTAFVDQPIAFWGLSEAIRKTAGLVAAMVWLVCAAGAYKEPLFRRRLVQLAMGAALIATVCWGLEPREEIREAGYRVPYGAAAGGVLLVLTVPAIFLLFRRKQTGKCRHCGYDLTGNLSGICPECGQATWAELFRRRRERAAEFARAFESPQTPLESPDDVGGSSLVGGESGS